MIREKRTIAITGIFLTLTAATVWAAIRKQEPKTQAKEQPTVVKEGEASEAQKKHGKIFSDNARKKLSSLPDGTKIITPAEQDLPMPGDPDFAQRKQVLVSDMACNADLVIVGKPVRKTTQLTESGDYVFTDYEIVAEDVIRNTSTAVPIGSTVTITRPGGSVILSGKRYQIIHGSFGPLSEGKTYLLFLKFNAEGNTYQAASRHATFLVDGNSLKSEVSYWPEDMEDANLFIASLRSASTGC